MNVPSDGRVGVIGAVVISALFIAEVSVAEEVAVFLLFGLCLAIF
jgi:hypothetical protein